LSPPLQMKKQILTGLILTILGINQLIAQDFHFSQFYSNPQLLNPALTGNFQEDYRVNLIHRNQWNTIGSKFQTTAFGGDINIQGGKLNKDKIGVGVQIYLDDQASVLSIQGFLTSLSYIHTLDGHRRHHLAGGVQFGYMRKNLNTDNLQFGSQYQNYQYNSSASSNESFDNFDLSSITLQAGISYSYDLTKLAHLFTGLSVYQITGPNESVTGSENKLGQRLIYNVGLEQQLTNKVKIIPQLMYMYQSKASDFNLGGLVKYELAPVFKTNLILGAFYRTSDAVIAVGGLEHKGIEAKISYDVTLSDLKGAQGVEGSPSNNMVGAWEVSIIFKGIFRNHNYANDYTVPCGIF
jgi:type IX secretion system PorP/SprF family membrane protein